MLRRLLCLLTFLSLCFGYSVAKNKSFPLVITNAKYVYITSYQGSNIASPELWPDTLQAMKNLREALRQWGYYTETTNPQEADLILRVRIGGASVQMEGGQGADRGGPPNNGNIYGGQGEYGSGGDLLEILYAKGSPKDPPLWSKYQKGGLAAPGVPLLQELRKQVEDSLKP